MTDAGAGGAASGTMKLCGGGGGGGSAGSMGKKLLRLPDLGVGESGERKFGEGETATDSFNGSTVVFLSGGGMGGDSIGWGGGGAEMVVSSMPVVEKRKSI